MKRALIAVWILAAYAGGCSGAKPPPVPVRSSEDVIAVVYGKEFHVSQKDRIFELIWGELFDHYVMENKLKPTDAEIDEFVAGKARMPKPPDTRAERRAELEARRDALMEELKSGELTDEERGKLAAELAGVFKRIAQEAEMARAEQVADEMPEDVWRPMARHFVLRWKFNKSLFDKYGGRVIFQQAGMEAFDATIAYFKEEEAKGAFHFFDDDAEKKFWHYYTYEQMHRFMDGEKAREAINARFWLMEAPLGE